jgi:serine/threonine-protein kinase SRPK3
MLDDFQVDSKNGVFQCVVHPPLAISIKAFRRMLPDRELPLSFVKLVLKHLLLGLDFLHTEAKVIHTGESSRIQERTPAFYLSRLLIAIPI